MSNAKSKSRKPHGGAEIGFEKARAKIRQEKNVRVGLSRFRYHADVETLLTLGSKFAAHSSYRSLIWPNPFPKRLNSLSVKGLPFFAGFDKELAWAASTICAHSDELNCFITLKERYEQLSLLSDFVQMEKLLIEIGERFGVSIWLIDQKISHSLQHHGYRAKNDYVKSVLSEDKSPPLIRYATTWLSYRSLVALSVAEFERLLTELSPPVDGFDYLVHLITGRFVEVSENTAGMMIWEADNLPLIDRYLLLIATLQALIASNPEGLSEPTSALRSIEKLAVTVKDKSLQRLMLALGCHSQNAQLDQLLIDTLDKYSSGYYAEVVNTVSDMQKELLSIEMIYIGIRSGSLLGKSVDLVQINKDDHPLLSSVCADLASIINFTEEGVEANLRLQKLTVINSGAPWASSLAAILEHQRNDERAFRPTPRQSYHTLRAHSEHPLSAFGYWQTEVSKHLLEEQLKIHTRSTTIPSLSAILEGPERIQNIFKADLPLTRSEMFAGLLQARHGNPREAVRYFEKVGESPTSQLLKMEALALLVRCYLDQGRIAECADVAAELFSLSRYFAVILPINDIVKELLSSHDLPMSISKTRGRLSVAIVFDAYSWYISSAHDAERADAFNDVLKKSGIKKASELVKRAREFSRVQLAYFLRYVCVPNVLDQSLALGSTRAVEDERATILVELSDLITSEGKQPPSEFKDELREIRTRQVVRDTTQRLDRSKVYVNVEGIRRAIDVSMRENWNRFRLIAQYGNSDPDVSNIERIVRSVLGELGDQVTVITLNAPLSERHSLFRKMVTELWDMLTTSQEYGLNSNLSTNIRHGYVLRELRGPLVGRNLITNKDSESGSYLDNLFWMERVQEYPQSLQIAMSVSLSAFSQRVDEQIAILNRTLLRIRSDKTPEGLFIYTLTEPLLQMLERRCSQLESYEDFIGSVVDQFWKVTESNLNRVRENLYNSTLHQLNETLNKLEEDLRANNVDVYAPGIMGSINLVRPEVRSAIERVASWFTLSGNNEYQDYDLEIAYQAGLQTVKTYYANIAITSEFESNRPVILKGSSLPIFARLFFLLLDNAAFHGAQNRTDLTISVRISLDDTGFMLEVSNDLPPRDFASLDLKIASINEDYGHEKAAELLGEEGGSGYPKIWKLLNFDLRRDHDLHVSRNEDNFVVRILIDPRGLI